MGGEKRLIKNCLRRVACGKNKKDIRREKKKDDHSTRNAPGGSLKTPSKMRAPKKKKGRRGGGMGEGKNWEEGGKGGLERKKVLKYTSQESFLRPAYSRGGDLERRPKIAGPQIPLTSHQDADKKLWVKWGNHQKKGGGYQSVFSESASSDKAIDEWGE